MGKKDLKVQDGNFLAVPEGAAEVYGDDAEENAKLVNDTRHTISIQGSRYQVDGRHVGPMEGIRFQAVVLQAMPLNTYYAKPFDPNLPEPPDCASLGGDVPDAGVASPQAESCAGCPMNEYGTAGAKDDGTKSKGKACSNKMRLVLHGSGMDMPAVLDLPPTSLKSFSSLIKKLSSNQPKVPLLGVVVEFSFASGPSHPQPELDAKSFLLPDEYQEMKALRDTAPVKAALSAFAELDDDDKEV